MSSVDPNSRAVGRNGLDEGAASIHGSPSTVSGGGVAIVVCACVFKGFGRRLVFVSFTLNSLMFLSSKVFSNAITHYTVPNYYSSKNAAYIKDQFADSKTKRNQVRHLL